MPASSEERHKDRWCNHQTEDSYLSPKLYLRMENERKSPQHGQAPGTLQLFIQFLVQNKDTLQNHSHPVVCSYFLLGHSNFLSGIYHCLGIPCSCIFPFYNLVHFVVCLCVRGKEKGRKKRRRKGGWREGEKEGRKEERPEKLGHKLCAGSPQ